MRFCDLRPGDHVVWKSEFGRKCRLEILVLNVDHENYKWTHFCLVDEHRPQNVGTVYTTPGTEASRGLWDCEGDGEIVSRMT